MFDGLRSTHQDSPIVCSGVRSGRRFGRAVTRHRMLWPALDVGLGRVQPRLPTPTSQGAPNPTYMTTTAYGLGAGKSCGCRGLATRSFLSLQNF